jgi:hypothetical protein
MSAQSPHLIMHSTFLMLFSIPQTGFFFNIVVQLSASNDCLEARLYCDVA